MYEVVYYSQTGNTRKVAEAMAEELGVTAKNIKKTDTVAPEAFVFLGTGCYGAVVPNTITKFLEKNRFQGRKIALFTTSCFGSKSERGLVEKQIRSKGVEITHEFMCTGHWMTMKRDRPSAADLAEAKKFARTVAAEQAAPAVKKIKVNAAAH